MEPWSRVAWCTGSLSVLLAAALLWSLVEWHAAAAARRHTP